MSVIELIGFVIAMVAFFALLWKQAREQKRQREHPEEFAREREEKEEALRELMQSMHIPVDKPRRQPPPPPPEIEEDQEVFLEVEETEEKHISGEKEALDIYAEGSSLLREVLLRRGVTHRGSTAKHRSHIQKILRSVDSLKEAVILREILGPPKGM